MPTYDYACRKCGHRFEHYQSMTSEVLKRCPKCKRDELERLIGAGAGILFKGSGFYETDYKRAGSKAEGSKTEGSKADAPAADGGKPAAGTTGAPKADAPKPGKDAGKSPPAGGGATKDGAPKGPAKPA